MQEYTVNEIFYTVQGEAKYTGHPSVFVRLQGCDVGCPWCDTKHTWFKAKHDEITPSEMMLKREDGVGFARMSVEQIMEQVRDISNPSTPLVTITGGEPAEQPLLDLTTAIIRQRYIAQIETSGTVDLEVHPDTWVTLSPKINMPNKKQISPQAVRLANEIKMPVGKLKDLENLYKFLDDFAPHIRTSTKIWLQPLSQNEKATALCLEACMLNGWNLSMQTHKYIGIR